jgi:restriction endonuclease Mrr
MLVILRRTVGGPATCDNFLADLGAFVDSVQPKDPESLLPTRVDDEPTLRGRLTDSITHLKEAGLLTEPEAGSFAATGRGKRLLEQNPRGIDDTVLERFVEFRRYIQQAGQASGPTEPTRDYKTGFNQYQDGSTLSDNPYDPETAAYQEWNLGWFEAFEEHLDHHRDGQHFPRKPSL